MILAAATPLLTVSMTHAYYGGPFEAFSVRAFPSTARLSRDLGLRLIAHAGTLTLFAIGNVADRLGVGAYQDRLRARALCWELEPSDPHFAAFTGVDFTGPGKALILANAQPGARGGLLTSSPKASLVDVWPRQPLQFTCPLGPSIKPGAALLLRTASGTVLRRYTAPDSRVLAIDTTDAGSGLYELVQNGVTLTQWLADERAPLQAVRGPVLVFPGELLAAAAQRAPAAPAYTAAFPSRSVVWRYHVFNAPDAAELAIGAVTTSEPGPSAAPVSADFRRLDQTVIPGAVSFEALQPTPLTARPPQRFALRRNGVDLRSPLPLESLHLARPTGNAAPYSDIFVHLQPQRQRLLN